MYDICALGEILIDAIASADTSIRITGNAGGAPANVLTCASRMGLKTAFLGKAGDDFIGRWLKSTLGEVGIDTAGLILDSTRNTTIAIVSLDSSNNRTITNIISTFLSSGIVSETGTLKGNLGRRSIGIRLNAEKFNVLAIKIARRSYSIGVFNIKNQILEKSYQKLDPSAEADGVLQSIVTDAQTLMQKYGSCCAVGVAVPGPYLRREGRIAVMTEFAGWEKIDIRKRLSSAFE